MPRDRDVRAEVESIVVDWRERRDRGERITPADVIAAHPALARELGAYFRALALVHLALAHRRRGPPGESR